MAINNYKLTPTLQNLTVINWQYKMINEHLFLNVNIPIKNTCQRPLPETSSTKSYSSSSSSYGFCFILCSQLAMLASDDMPSSPFKGLQLCAAKGTEWVKVVVVVTGLLVAVATGLCNQSERLLDSFGKVKLGSVLVDTDEVTGYRSQSLTRVDSLGMLTFTCMTNIKIVFKYLLR